MSVTRHEPRGKGAEGRHQNSTWREAESSYEKTGYRAARSLHFLMAVTFLRKQNHHVSRDTNYGVHRAVLDRSALCTVIQCQVRNAMIHNTATTLPSIHNNYTQHSVIQVKTTHRNISPEQQNAIKINS